MKSDQAFRTISEVSEELGVPQHVLRFWETRFAQVRPLKRNGGRRLYRPDHLGLLRGIRALLYDDGMTIKGVQKILREKGVRAVAARGESPEALPLAPPPDAANRLGALRARFEAGTETPERSGEPDGGATAAGGDAETAPASCKIERVRGSIARLERILQRLEAG